MEDEPHLNAETVRTVPVPDKPRLGGQVAPCPVVGVGASAGGLEAFRLILEAAEPGQGLAYILVQHLDPNHDSMLVELLARNSTLPVSEISNSQSIQPDHVYILEPNRELTIKDGRLHLHPFEDPRGSRRPIDHFFASLGADQTTNSVCVVLSGTGNDGSAGLRSVKEAGGLTIAQSIDEGAFDGMPSNAVETGLVDLVVSAREMPRLISDYFSNEVPDLGEDGAANRDFLSRVCEAVQFRTGHDFSNYKTSTISRRVARRMQVVGISDRADYIQHIMADQSEGMQLFRDLLINVTGFFRDTEAFEALATKAIATIMREKEPEDQVRVWVPACSGGEEAYSIAMLIAEEIGDEMGPRVNIFASDIDPAMLEDAREGIYSSSVVEQVPKDLLDKYFVAEDGGYRVCQRLRKMVRVSEHSVIKDSPFSRLDLVSCRNMLIYFDRELQSRVLPIFHYALNDRGFLFLGSSENLAGHDNLMQVVDHKHRIYRRASNRRDPVSFPIAMSPRVAPTPRPVVREVREVTGPLDEADIKQRVVERYSPPFVVLNSDAEVVYSSGRTGRYLEFGFGRPTNRIFDLAKPGLRSAIRAVLEDVSSERSTTRVVKRGVVLEVEDGKHLVDVSCERLKDASRLLVFQEQGTDLSDEPDDDIEVSEFDADARIDELESELTDSRRTLRSAVGDLETSNEELKSSNEEMMSMNEELQSANEELSTINDELKNKIDALAQANDDIQNFLESSQIATIFVDRDLRIRSFTPEAKDRLKLSNADRDRVIDEVRTAADTERLRVLGQQVLTSLEPVEEPIRLRGERGAYQLRVLPYKTVSNEVQGIVYVLNDVTHLTDTARQLAEAREEALLRLSEVEQIYTESPVAMCLIDKRLKFLRANAQMGQIIGMEPDDILDRTAREVMPDLASEIEPHLRQVLNTGEPLVGLEMEGTSFPNTEPARQFLADYHPFVVADEVIGVTAIVQDITELRRQDREVKYLMQELQHRVKNMLANVLALVRQARRADGTANATLEQLASRVQALADTNSLLSAQGWRRTDLSALLNSELIKPYGNERISFGGPDLPLNARAAMAMTMALHEMATNAVKYGALSNETGTISITWAVADHGSGYEVQFKWEEEGGPAISPPDSLGFGSTLVKASVSGTLDGRIDFDYPASGFCCRASIPLSAIQVDERQSVESSPDSIIKGEA